MFFSQCIENVSMSSCAGTEFALKGTFDSFADFVARRDVSTQGQKRRLGFDDGDFPDRSGIWLPMYDESRLDYLLRQCLSLRTLSPDRLELSNRF
jgi:hypothetical protein